MEEDFISEFPDGTIGWYLDSLKFIVRNPNGMPNEMRVKAIKIVEDVLEKGMKEMNVNYQRQYKHIYE